MKQLNNKKGFTLIEVVLVLAIGGLIFLLAFIAFQQASIGRRDTQRRADAVRVIGGLQSFYSDKNSFPLNDPGSWSPSSSSFQSFMSTYMGGLDFKDPQGNIYTYVHTPEPGTDLSAYNNTPAPGSFATISTWPLTYGLNKKCASNGTSLTSAQGSVAVIVRLEKGDVCRDAKG